MKFINNRTHILIKLFFPQRRKPNPRHAIPEADKNLSGKTIVFTGGTDGMGRVAVEMLYQMGANIILLARSKVKGAAVVRDLAAYGGRGTASLQFCDLSSMQSVKDCAGRILDENERIDVLVNCAGINATNRIITEEGFELNWAVNYLGPYLLSTLLGPRLRESAPSRIVNLTTNTLFIDRFDLDQIRERPDFATDNTYVTSKLALEMFTLELAYKLKGTGVTVTALYPGYIRSNLLRYLSGAERTMQFFMRIMASPPEVGADRIVRLAISSEYQGVTGVYVSEDDIRPPHPEVQIDEKRKQLIELTENRLSKWME